MLTVFQWFLPIAVVVLILGAGPARAADAPRKDRAVAADRVRAQWQINDDLAVHDPELAAIGGRLVFGEILDSGSLNDKQRALLMLVGLTVGQNWEAFREWLNGALGKGAAEPVEIKEALYQIVPYVGFPRVDAALKIVNDALLQRGIALPLPPQGTTSETDRFNKGFAVQRGIFGEHIDKMHENAPEGQRELVINYLSAFCFGDFYTRQGIDLKMRELVVFAAIVSLGGCDAQARGHAAGNMAVGNSRQNLVDALAVLLPVNGFPRTLNGLAAVNAAATEEKNN